MEHPMNDVTKDILMELSPEMALLVYRHEQKYYLERRDIINGKMAAGIPLTEECLTNIFDSISSDESDMLHGSIPDNMLYADGRCGREKYVWYNKPERRNLLFSKEAGISDGQMWIPGLVYVASATTLSVFAFKGNKPKSKLFKAPFFNIYDSGKVCLGSAQVDKPSELTYERIVQYWEKMFWASEFVHILGNNPVKNNLATLLKKGIETDCRFPEDELLPVKTNLKELLR
ncbi:MAG: PRTRC system protein B [Tannerellaceae bacterium]